MTIAMDGMYMGQGNCLRKHNEKNEFISVEMDQVV